MAHFLSEVTHQRLEQREGTDESMFSNGVTATHDFDCQARCVEVIPTQSSTGALSDMAIWTGNIDGSIVIRRGLDGEPVATIDGKKNVFVYSLLAVDDVVWAGMSDGYVAIFNLETADKVCEVKAHIGAVNCMSLIDDTVFTGGSDWQICRWEPTTLERVAHGQFSGHQNAVRCMIAEPGVLYSGGDDNCVRAWDLSTGLEKAAPWPIVAHDNAVRSLAIHEVYLFSSSSDGTVKVWNTQTAQLVRQLDCREAAVNTLLLDTPNARLWSGATDGTISLWDANNLCLVGQINSHHNTHVALIKEVARVNAVKAWTISTDGVIRTWYCDNDPLTADFDALADMEANFQQEIEVHRSKIISNYRELENAKLKLQELEALDHRKKVLIGESFGRAKQNELKAVHQAQAVHWLHKQQREKHKRLAVVMLQETNEKVLMKARFSNLLAFCKAKKEHRRKMVIVAQLQRKHNENLRRVYVNNVLEHGRRHFQQAHRSKLSDAMCAASSRNQQVFFYFQWQRYVKRMKLLRKRAEIATAIVNKVDDNLAAVYWSRLEKFTKKERNHEKTREAVKALGLTTDRNLMLYYYRRLQLLVRVRKASRASAAASAALVFTGDNGILREAYEKWTSFAKIRRSTDILANVTSQRELLTGMERKLDASAAFTEAQLEEELRQKQIELATILQGNRELDIENKDREHRNKSLQRELLKDVSLEHDRPPLEVLSQAMHFLKARGVNIYHDLETIMKAREAAKATSPAAVYEDGITAVRKVCSTLIRPHKLKEKDSYDWMVGDLFHKITKRGIAKANTGICMLVTAYDMMNVSQLNAWLAKEGDVNDPWGPKHKHNNELLNNFGVFLEIALRQYRIRRNEDPLTGLPLEPVTAKRARSRSRSASAARGRSTSAKPAGKRSKSAPGGKKSASAKPKGKKSKSAKPRAKSAPAGKKPAGKKSGKKPKAKRSSSGKKPGAKRSSSKKPADGAAKPAGKRTASKPAGKRSASKPKPKAKRSASAAVGTKPTA